MKALALILLSVIASGVGQLLLRSGARSVVTISLGNIRNASTWISLLSSWQIAAGLLAWGVSTLLWLIVLNRTELSYAYCLGSLNYVIIPLVSHWLFDEHLNGTRLLGMGIIFIGVLITIYGRYVA